MKLRFGGKLFTAFAACVFTVFMCGCASSNHDASVNEAGAENQEVVNGSDVFNLDTQISFDGIETGINSLWTESVLTNDYERKYLIKSSDDRTISTIEIRGYLNGETLDIDTFKEAWGYNTSYETIETWDDEDKRFCIFAGTANAGNWASYLTGYTPDGKGFSIFFSLGEYAVAKDGYITDENKAEIIDFYKQVRWNPSETTLDSLDIYLEKKTTTTSNTAKSQVNEIFGFPTTERNSIGGTVGIFHASTEACTPENLAIWYGDYVTKNGHAWDVILYTNKQGFGVYASAGMIETNVELEKESDGTYIESGSSEATLYSYDSATKSLTKIG